MAEHGFYRSSGAAWQRALPPELCRPDDGEVLRRGWDLLALDREGARRLTARGGLRCRTLLLPLVASCTDSTFSIPLFRLLESMISAFWACTYASSGVAQVSCGAG